MANSGESVPCSKRVAKTEAEAKEKKRMEEMANALHNEVRPSHPEAARAEQIEQRAEKRGIVAEPAP